MNTLKRAWNEICRVVLVIFIVGMAVIAPMQAAYAADPSYSPGAPDSPSAKQKTIYQGKGVSSAEAQPGAKQMMKKIERDMDKENSDRPKTMREWNQEAEETEGNLGQRVKRIAKETEEAVKDFGQMYPNTAERSGDALQESLDRSN
ncbi:MAG: hypothetical protein MUC48_13240 [Leptolyngbya sp. Prado105]|jgi:hypothetical protein|nr:hypothetical protein [Leptolyngbya sp. Prado105]